MRTIFKAMLGVVFGLFLFTAISLMGGDRAQAGSAPSKCHACTAPTTPCNCTTPTPPPANDCGCDTGHGGGDHGGHGGNVNVTVNTVVNANAASNASGTGSGVGTGTGTGTGSGSGMGFGSGLGLANGFGSGTGFGAGYGSGASGPGFSSGVVSSLPDFAVETAPARTKRQVAYEATRTKTIKIIIEAFCLDDKGEPHPASQVFPEKDVENDYEGELYRCIAGTRMQYIMADFNEKTSFDGGKTITCDKDQALYHTKDAKLECRRQAPARDCNERSLLRRFGAGIKILTIVTVETYTAYREEEEESSSVTTSSSSSSSATAVSAAGGVVTGSY
jgi:hypothetical protein